MIEQVIVLAILLQIWYTILGYSVGQKQTTSWGLDCQENLLFSGSVLLPDLDGYHYLLAYLCVSFSKHHRNHLKNVPSRRIYAFGGNLKFRKGISSLSSHSLLASWRLFSNPFFLVKSCTIKSSNFVAIAITGTEERRNRSAVNSFKNKKCRLTISCYSLLEESLVWIQQRPYIIWLKAVPTSTSKHRLMRERENRSTKWHGADRLLR